MIRIKHQSDIVTKIDGFCLYVNGIKTHIGYFNTLKDVRNFWREYMHLLLNGYVYQLDGMHKMN
jgi:uncharacterized membrane protein HdeD (DUF308 family)